MMMPSRSSGPSLGEAESLGSIANDLARGDVMTYVAEFVAPNNYLVFAPVSTCSNVQ